MSRRRLLGCVLALLGLAWGLAGPLSSQEGLERSAAAERDPLLKTGIRRSIVVSAIERVKTATVNIHSERHVPLADPHGTAGNRVNGMGTGIIIDPRGYIVTNQHVVEDVSVLRIRLADGSAYYASIVARNPDLDLALIKIDPKEPLDTMPIGTALDLMVGETVVALGNAFGYEHTASLGIVSALKRDVSLNKEMSYKSLIQTDAAINPGNSGGPLINVHGELVGVNVAIRAGAQGIGFSIPVDHMVRCVSDMLRNRRRGTNYDGVTTRDRLEPGGGGMVRTVVVENVDATSPAARAGLRGGDVLVQVAEVKVLCGYDYERALLDRRAGESVQLKVLRKGEVERLEMVLAAPDKLVRPVAATDVVWTRLGMQLTPVGADLVKGVNKSLNGGLEITAVQAESVAAKAGLKKGDVLVGLHMWETVSLDNVTYVLTHPDLSTFQPLSFFIVRGGHVRKGTLSSMP